MAFIAPFLSPAATSFLKDLRAVETASFLETLNLRRRIDWRWAFLAELVIGMTGILAEFGL